ncbi:MAG: glycerol-3-phosphate 1-O-acyltransferase PlsY [Puniceicoccales bacterium]|jgi:glycerol-3-phosphate acyltransferase PlsY|nr:glycerol-3-phosphate 1-O-acyltransferase PlsY [Puniceicoccales bacterium]
MNWCVILFFAFVGYLIGSVLFARVVSHFYGIDIGNVGSGNPGATNVVRSAGKFAGTLTFLGDFFKSFATVMLALKPRSMGDVSSVDLGISAMLGVVLGHNFSIFFKFKGGKGVSATMGGISALMPGTAIVGILLWGIIFHATRFVSAASLFFAISLPITSFAFGYNGHCVTLAIIMATVIFWCHRSNIKKLWNGSEYRFERK